MNIKVEKLTDATLLRRANAFTTGHGSKMSLAKAYCCQHSPIRTQLFWVECYGIPLFVASHFVRHNVGVQFFQLSKRPDRGGEDFREVCNNLANDLIMDSASNFADDFLNDVSIVRELPKRFDRYTPVDLAFIANAESLMNMAHKRLCFKASAETRAVMLNIRDEIEKADPDLAMHMIPQCIYRGDICSEPKSCGWIKGKEAAHVLTPYLKLFE